MSIQNQIRSEMLVSIYDYSKCSEKHICINSYRLCLLALAVMAVGKQALIYMLVVESIMTCNIVIVILQQEAGTFTVPM